MTESVRVKSPSRRQNLAEYLTGVLAGIRPLRPLELALLDAHGGVLADDVIARAAVPAYDASAIDGYAVRSDDVSDARSGQPVTLSVIGEVRAAAWQASRVSPGSCYQVAAGSALPAGADTVIPLADTDRGVVTVAIGTALRRNQNVLRTGEQVKAGAVVASAGQLVTPGLVGLLAAAGIDHVQVRPKPRVVVVSTGDELADIGAQAGPGQVLDVNSYSITAAARAAGGQPIRVGIVGDEPEPLRESLEDHSMRADLIVITGGTGDTTSDTVRSVLGRDNTVDFAELPLYPASVLGYGKIGPDETPVVSLPGDPAQALIGFEVLAWPVLQRLAGADPVFRPSVKAALLDSVTSPSGLREFRPAVVSERRGGGYTVRPLPGGSMALTGLAEANALMVLGEKISQAPAGSTVDVLVFDRRR